MGRQRPYALIGSESIFSGVSASSILYGVLTSIGVIVAISVASVGLYELRNGNPALYTNDTLIVYVGNSANAFDSNDGVSASTPVRTLQRAIQVLGSFKTFETCIVHILGQVTIAEETISFFPAALRCNSIIVRGERSSQVRDTVASISHSGPRGTWRAISGATLLTLQPNFYQSYMIENLNQQRVYVVEGNDASQIKTIAGDVSTNITGDEIPYGPSLFATRKNAWYVGDAFELYRLATSINFGGSVKILTDIPISFVDVEISGAINATWANPATATPLVSFQGCRIFTGSALLANRLDEHPGFSGSMMLNGVFVQGTVQYSQFNVFQNDACIKSESIWLNYTTINYMSQCNAFFLLGTLLQNDIFIASSQFYGYGIDIRESDGLNAMRIFSSQYYIHGMEISRTIGTGKPGFSAGTGVGLYLDGGSIGTLQQISVFQNILPSTGFQRAIWIQNAKVFARNGFNVTILTSDAIEAQAGAEIVIFYENIYLSASGNVMNLISSKAQLRWATQVTVSAGGYGFFLAGGSSLQMGVLPYIALPISINTGLPFVRMLDGSNVQAMIFPETNAGPGGMLALDAIGPAPIPWSTTNDLSQPATQNCFFTKR